MISTYGIKFYCRQSKANKEGLAKVEVSININKERVFLALPYETSPKSFNSKHRKEQDENYIALMRSRINDILNDMASKGEPLTALSLKDRLKDYIAHGGFKPYTIDDCFTQFLAIKKKRIGVDLDKKSYRKYEIIQGLFYKHVNKDADINTVEPATIENFFAELCRKYNKNTAISYIHKLKSVIMFAKDNGKLKINPFQTFKAKKETNPIVYLTAEELETIRTHEYSTKALRRCADMFLLQAYSGLSYCDLEALKEDDIIVTDDGTAYISKPRIKTHITYNSVILPNGVEILRSYGFFSNDGQVHRLPIISNQKTNCALKAIARECGIDKNISTHTGRKSYASFLIEKNIPIDHIASALGHSSPRTTLEFYTTYKTQTVVNSIASAIH